MTATVPSPALDSVPTTARMERINRFLDNHILPYPVRYLTNRITILGTLSLLIPLILLANVTVFVLAANSYLNVMSVVVSSTVLLYSTLSEARDKAAAARREEIAAVHEKIMDERADADHQRIQEIHMHLEEIRQEIKTHVNAQLETIQRLLVEQINDLHTEAMLSADERRSQVQAAFAENRRQIEAINQMLSAIQPPSSGPTKPVS